jgi:anti-anti-sigma factor
MDGLTADVLTQRHRHIVRLTGELDLAGAPRLRSILADCLAAGDGMIQLVVDVGGLRFIDCAGVRVLVDAARLAAESSRSFHVCSAGGQVEEVLRLLGLDELLGLPAPGLGAAERPPTVSGTP